MKAQSDLKRTILPIKALGVFMWPWQAFDWRVFWAIIAAAFVCWIARDLILVIVAYLKD